MNALPPPSGGLFDSLRALLATALAMLQTRFELFATELEEEKLRLLAVLAYGLAALFLLGLGVVALAAFLVVMFWDTQPLLVIGLLAVVFLGSGLLAGMLALRRLRSGSRLFGASLAELTLDRAALHDLRREQG